MLELNVKVDGENKTYNVPTEWSEVNVGQFIEFYKLSKSSVTNIDLMASLLHILSGADLDLIYMIDVKDFEAINNALEFTKTEISSDPVEYVELNGEKYWLKKDFGTLNLGESISIESIIDESEGKLEIVMDKLLCIFLRKKREDGELEDFRNTFMNRAEEFRNVKISDVFKLFIFFSNGNK